ncbi:MAG: hypothetical protein JNL50_02430 [Phycisphaerae bacterium]|nr:hypothetical protein [Phycisphaerae bacterium]
MTRVRDSMIRIAAGPSPKLAAGPVTAPDIERAATPGANLMDGAGSTQGTTP